MTQNNKRRFETHRLDECAEILDSKRVPITASNREPGPYPYYGANGVQDWVANYLFDDELVLLAEDGGNFGSSESPIAYRVSGKCWVNNHAHVLKPKEGIDADYLCYSLMHYDTSKLINGSTRSKLTQAAMRKMTVRVRSKDEQTAIVQHLNGTKRSIDQCRALLRALDELVKSRFIEMFGGERYPQTDSHGLEMLNDFQGYCCRQSILNLMESSPSPWLAAQRW